MALLETKESMLLTLEKWNKTTFGDAYSELAACCEDQESLKLLKKVIKHQDLDNKQMNGWCSEGVKVAEFERMGVKYVDFFNELEKSGEYWPPLNILHNICKNNLARKDFYEKKAKDKNMSFERVTWLMCGRALRALPSYIREYQLKNELQELFPDATLEQNEELDKNYHCDIKLNLNNNEYYVWSFVSSTRSIVNFAQKFKALRYGKVPNGYHILCPYDVLKNKDSAFYGWMFYSKGYMQDVKKAVEKAALQYDDVVNASVYNLEFYKKPTLIKKEYDVDKSTTICL